jgi:hypothetical protein
MNSLDQLISAAGGVLFFFGPGLVGAAILFFAARWAMTQRQVVTWGIVGGALMALDSVFLFALAGIASATSGSQRSYQHARWVILFFVGCVLAYSIVAPQKAERRRERRDKKDGEQV